MFVVLLCVNKKIMEQIFASDLETRLAIVKRNVEEIIGEEELIHLMKTNQPITHYIGFELSGKVHLGGLLCMAKVKDFMDAGFKITIFLADIHSWLNDKLGGDLSAIREIGVEYFKEAFAACFKCLGGDPSQLNFVLGSELYHNNDVYWYTMLKVCKKTTLSRMKRSISITGKQEGENVSFGLLIYPAMQAADALVLGVTMMHSGSDQRKAHVVVRDIAPPFVDKFGVKIKPIAIHHHLLLGLTKPSIWPIPTENKQELWTTLKMSKSKPNSAIFIHDSLEEIQKKINGAFCLPNETDFNPIIDWVKHLVFEVAPFGTKVQLTIKRDAEFGGDVVYNNYAQLERDFKEGKLHPMDLKDALTKWLIAFLEPARQHFASGKPKELLEKMNALQNKQSKN
ncbi:MAG: tyrosine--tRNA ligase [Euryarchaeota archaeon HGW-Euryarchaeota-1]|nr:MAG: tyrosine--tRNA ligase [Euryarchaeota archaeon HGW-Euryarchaeota-1]